MTRLLAVFTIIASLALLVWYAPLPHVSAAEWFTNAAPYQMSKSLWDDLRAPVAGLSQGAAAADPGTWGTSGGIRVFRFGVNEDVDGALQFPHGYKNGTDIYPHVHWGPVSTAAGNVKWCWDYSWLDIGEATGAPTTAQCAADAAAGGTAFAHKLTALPTIDGHTAPKTGVSSIIVFRLYRGTADTSEYGADVALIEFDIHYEMDALGSRTEYTK